MEPRLASREGAALALEATYALASPAFLSGADRTRAEVRLPSLKGVLRFWWRALQAQRIQGMERLRAREAMLFGSAEVGQSSVSMRLLSPLDLRPEQRLDTNRPAAEMFAPTVTGRPAPSVHGLLYLGYGVIDTARKTLSRACLRAPLEVRVRLVWRPFSGKPRGDAATHARDEAVPTRRPPLIMPGRGRGWARGRQRWREGGSAREGLAVARRDGRGGSGAGWKA